MENRKGRGGFTLVELLVGVTILAIIIVPVVNAFLTSQHAANRAGEMRSQTLAAQNVIESYKTTDINTLVDLYKKNPVGAQLGTVPISSIGVRNASGTYDPVTPTSTETKSSAAYKVYLTGADAGSQKYDAVLSVDAASYPTANKAEIVDYKAIDELYTQPDPNAKYPNLNLDNPDIIAASEFASKAQVDSGTAVAPTDFYSYDPVAGVTSKMTRKITITIKRVGGAPGVISCEALFHYDAKYTYPVTDRDGKTHNSDAFYSKDVPVEFLCNVADQSNIKGVFFFYYPNGSAQSDTIEILNRDNLVLSVNLVRQSANDVTYNPAIILREAYVSPTEKQHTTLHYNNVALKEYNYKYFAGYLSNGVYNDYAYDPSGKFDGNMVDTPVVNRLYGVKVELYKAGTNFSGSPLSSFDASALN